MRLDPWVRKIPWRRAWPPTPVFLSGESHGQRSLAGYRPWGRRETDRTEVTTHASTPIKYANSYYTIPKVENSNFYY